MTFRMEERGYPVERFQDEVREDLRCSFCFNVPEDARLCKNHDHFFCLAHISHHLQNSGICPVCKEVLTPETLRRPTGFIKNYIDDLMISCKYRARGCPEHIRLEGLENHVDQCGFAPAVCENEGCGMDINKRDKKSHEQVLCQFRIDKCHDCRDIKTTQDQLNAGVDQIQESQNIIMNQLNEIIANQDDVENIRDSMKKSEDQMKTILSQLKRRQGEMRASQDEMNAKLVQMRASQNEMNAKLEQMRANQDAIRTREQIRTSQFEMRARPKQIRASRNEMNTNLRQMTASQDKELKNVIDDIAGRSKRQRHERDDDTVKKKMKYNVDKVKPTQVGKTAVKMIPRHDSGIRNWISLTQAAIDHEMFAGDHEKFKDDDDDISWEDEDDGVTSEDEDDDVTAGGYEESEDENDLTQNVRRRINERTLHFPLYMYK